MKVWVHEFTGVFMNGFNVLVKLSLHNQHFENVNTPVNPATEL